MAYLWSETPGANNDTGAGGRRSRLLDILPLTKTGCVRDSQFYRFKGASVPVAFLDERAPVPPFLLR